MSLLKKWFYDLEVALVFGVLASIVLLFMAPFFINISFMYQPVEPAQALKIAFWALLPMFISVIIYTIIFIKKEVM